MTLPVQNEPEVGVETSAPKLRPEVGVETSGSNQPEVGVEISGSNDSKLVSPEVSAATTEIAKGRPYV